MVDTNVVIIGSGPAGYTAAIYAARADLAPVLIEGPEPGGQLMWTTEVENFPGFAQGIVGPELMQAMRAQAARFGSIMKSETVTGMTFGEQHQVTTDKEVYRAKAIIIASGASAKWLGLPNEQRLRGKGVSACATCDGFFFRNKIVAVVGGGDAAMEEAMYLTKFATRVHVLVRGAELRASKIMGERAKNNPKIEFHFESGVEDVLGDQAVTGLLVATGQEKKTWTLECQGLFVAIGHAPNTGLSHGQLETDKKGYYVVKDQVFSSVPGVFIAGDVADWRYRQAITAAGAGCMAALEAERYLHQREAHV